MFLRALGSRTVSVGISFRFPKENRFRRDDLLLSSGAGRSGTTRGCSGCGVGGPGVYVLGARIKGTGSDSSSGSGSGEGEGGCRCSGSGLRSRSWTSWKAGRVARIAGVIIFGSWGRVLSIDFRISRD